MSVKSFLRSKLGILALIAWVLSLAAVVLHQQAQSVRASVSSKARLEEEWQETISSFRMHLETLNLHIDKIPKSEPFPAELALARLGDFLQSLTSELKLSQKSGSMVVSGNEVVWEWTVLGTIDQTLSFLKEVSTRRSDLMVRRWDLAQEPTLQWRLITEVSYEPY